MVRADPSVLDFMATQSWQEIITSNIWVLHTKTCLNGWMSVVGKQTDRSDLMGKIHTAECRIAEPRNCRLVRPIYSTKKHFNASLTVPGIKQLANPKVRQPKKRHPDIGQTALQSVKAGL